MTVADNRLHADPGIEGHDLHPRRSALVETDMQRDRARTIFEKSAPGRRAFVAPSLDVPASELPEKYRRAEPPRLPEIAEPEIVRHYNRLSKRNFDLDTGFYPLGSCTMKHNPKLHERVAALPGNARLHPLQSPRRAQGALELMWSLQNALAEIAGLPHVSLQPSAGSHGELAGVLLTRAYHLDRGDERTKILTPDTAHGTNPATVTMGGYEVVKVGTNADGGVDIDDLRAKADDDVACLMLTNPNTLGLFDTNIEEIARVVHGVGATLYYDGANLNAVMGRTRPGDMGFDIVHFNLHKTFTQPHGGGGPGAGPIAVSDRIEPYLMKPQVVRGSDGTFDLDYDRPKSIGRLRGFQGNYGVFVRSYAYVLSLGADGLQEASETAVLNANYLLARLRALGVTEHLPPAYERLCMHEFVLSGAPMKRELGLRTLDLAKRLLDFGFHPPTVYFPLLVDEALLVEPTETETRETLDAFADGLAAILREGAEDPEIARNAPYGTPVRRLDEAGAAKRPVIRQAL
ncbi:MAG TPA: aminomethyl-transferring glycine dehydrogenase subunit GcvPB [Solirubrobacter sp.]|nr:aminomethyl-transferring glycine dehydrogenase subunit GcvPB [Solirubrobacter sp.]